MIVKEDFSELETNLDNFAKQKQLKNPEAIACLDQYFDLLISYFKQINQIEVINFDAMHSYPVVPMNFQERYTYMLERKHHFMGYRQMKTLKTELIKMNAAYQIKQKRSQS
ncbi:hypothetical protein MHZ36_10140 [Staphylococcus sp. ACRSN]|uniref:YpoC family protein n=1 Tax=Staphylococcus sp. ACRSN TaxID=2918214 RepID=UPI001EF26D5F|nr:hypothetical protein [Staphylococcus sp. ACRSN]MCG7339651.1 hypothetical protein [Staphylococcus sp. ACRSN]